MKNQIPEFLQEKLQFKSPKVKNYPDEIKQFIKEYGEFYNFNLGDNLTAILKLIKDNIDVIPICEYAGCNEKVSITKQGNLDKGCCRSHKLKITNLEKYGFEHNQLNPLIAEKTKKTNIERYGFENPLLNASVKKKIKKTNMEKYGVDNVFKSDEIKKQITKTLNEKYGVDHPMQHQNIKDKFKNSMQEKYGCEWAQQNNDILSTTKRNNIKKFGVENPMMNPKIVDKAKQTCLKKYGFTSYSQTTESKMSQVEYSQKMFESNYYFTSNKFRQHNIEKFGVEHVMQNPKIAEKSSKNAYRMKKYTWKTGEISLVQGNEPIVLRELEDKGYTYNDVKTSKSDMPVIHYIFEDKTKRYYPDMFISKENVVIEVKSNYTLNLHWERNQAKFDATRKLGYDLRVEIR